MVGNNRKSEFYTSPFSGRMVDLYRSMFETRKSNFFERFEDDGGCDGLTLSMLSSFQHSATRTGW